MLSFIGWYLLLTLVGWAAFPTAYRALPALRDRGYALARALGLLLWGFAFWLLASLHLLQNDLGGALLALALVAGLSAWLSRGGRWREVVTWVRANAGVILSVEALFLAAFALWAFIRSANPEILYTEKPMELAFINAILRSPSFPPNDPWLSGYAISYYYFGYVIVALITRVTGTDPNVAFNLASAAWFALSAVGAYGLLFNLLSAYRPRWAARARNAALTLAVLAPLFLLLVSNMEGALEVLHARGLFWQPSGETYVSPFWEKLGILELNQPPPQPFSWEPKRSGWLWWRASRVLEDTNYSGTGIEVIDEFPYFSYLLSDLHPHVLAMPFGLLCVGLALNLFLGGARGSFGVQDARLKLSPGGFVLAAAALGGMAFLNTWDFPIYVALFSGSLALREYQREGWSPSRVGEFLLTGLAVGLAGILLYLPFYAGFQSQAGGILPSGVFFTRGAQFWVMFAPLLIPMIAFLLREALSREGRSRLMLGIVVAFAAVAGLWAASYLFLTAAAGVLAASRPELIGLFLGVQGAPGNLPISALLTESLGRRLAAPGTWLTLFGVIALGIAVLGRRERVERVAASELAAMRIATLEEGVEAAENGGEAEDDIRIAKRERWEEEPSDWGKENRDKGLHEWHQADAGDGPTIVSRVDPEAESPDARREIALAEQADKTLDAGAKTTESDKEIVRLDDGDAVAGTNPRVHAFVALLVLVGAALTLVPEFFYLRDNFGWRMNTIFKFYFQAWILWSIAAAYASAVLLTGLRGFRAAAFSTLFAVVLFASLVYPVVGTLAKTNNFQPADGFTLDGLAYLKRANPDEAAAMAWLREDAPLGVVSEAIGGAYSDYARVSVHTGLPAVQGWGNHEGQWRGSNKELGTREQDIATLYRTSSWETAQQIIARYNIRYIFVGNLERSTYEIADLKIAPLLNPVFQQGGVSVYEVPDPGAATTALSERNP